MIFNILLNMIGALATSSVNVLYPSYNYCATYSYHSNDLGAAYYTNSGSLVISKFDLESSALVYYNDRTDYVIKNLSFGITLSYYEVTGSETYTLLTSYDIDLVVPNDIDSSNIDDANFFIQFDYSDNIEWEFTNPYADEHTPLVNGSFNIPIGECDNYFSYGYTLGFTGSFKSDLLYYISSSSSNAYDDGYNVGYNDGYTTAYGDGEAYGYQNGFTDGFNDASNQDQTALTIFTGIVEVGLLPVNVFLGILNFEVFGINIGGLMASFMTIAIVVIIIRVITGKKDD